MARAGRKDRGLLSKLDSTGKLMWYVRLYHEGQERRFGAFKNKTEARDFYEKAKQEQKQKFDIKRKNYYAITIKSKE